MASGDLKIENGVVFRDKGDGNWWPVPLASEQPEPKRFTVGASGVWYVSREMETIWHGERHDMLEIRRLGREEREIAKVLLRCALARLEEMED